MKATNIEWDVDHENDRESLPTEIEIPEDITDENEISDYISDVTGYCHKGFNLILTQKDYEQQSKKLAESRTIATNLGFTGKHYYIWNPKLNVPLCYDNKALTFSTEEYARNLAESHLTKDEYKIEYKEFVHESGHIDADGLIIERVDEKLSNDAYSCNDYLVEAD